MTGRAKDKLRSLLQPTQGRLRGIGDNAEEALDQAADDILEAKNLLKSVNVRVKQVQELVRHGDNEAAYVTLKEMEEEVQVQQSDLDKLGASILSPHKHDFRSADSLHHFSVFSPSELLEQDKTFDNLNENTDLAIDTLDSLHSHVTEIKSGAELGKGGEYNFEGVESGFSTNTMFDFGIIAKSSSFRTAVSNIVKDKTSFYRHRLKQHYPEGHVERHLQRTANIKQCEQECAFDNTSCTCEELKQCALEMSSYDLSLLVLGDYVNTQKESPEYGNFIAENLNLFGIATTTLPAKFARIRRLAKTGIDCKELLTEFTTMCDPEASSCSSKNEYAHQLTTEQVCVSVGSAKKLRISAM